MSTLEQSLRRTPLYRWHQVQGAEFSGQLVQRYNKYPRTQNLMGLTDLSGLLRVGFKGVDTPTWLEAQGVELSEQVNTAILSKGLVTARLSEVEFLILSIDGLGEEKISSLRANWSMDIPERTYLLERADSHACFAISGPQCADVMAKVCAIDLRAHKFAPLQAAQTSVARSNAIVLRIDKGADQPLFLILADLSAAEFLWECLLDAMQEFSGIPLSFPDYLERLK